MPLMVAHLFRDGDPGNSSTRAAWRRLGAMHLLGHETSYLFDADGSIRSALVLAAKAAEVVLTQLRGQA